MRVSHEHVSNPRDVNKKAAYKRCVRHPMTSGSMKVDVMVSCKLLQIQEVSTASATHMKAMPETVRKHARWILRSWK